MAKRSKRFFVESDDDSDGPSIIVQETPRHLLTVQLPPTPVSPEFPEVKNKASSQDIVPDSPSRRGVIPGKSVQRIARAPFGSQKQTRPQRKARKVADERNKTYADETQKYLAELKRDQGDSESVQSDETLDCIVVVPNLRDTKTTGPPTDEALIQPLNLIKAKTKSTGKSTGTKTQSPADTKGSEKVITKRVTSRKLPKLDVDRRNGHVDCLKLRRDDPRIKNLLSAKPNALESTKAKKETAKKLLTQQTDDQQVSLTEDVEEATTTQMPNGIPTDKEKASSKKFWDIFLEISIQITGFENLSVKILEKMVDENTPWKYLIFQKFPDLAPEEQALLLLRGISNGWLSQSSFISLATNPPLEPPNESPEISSWIKPQLQLGLVIRSLRGCVDFHLTSIFASMQFNSVLPTLLTTDACLATENAHFKRLDDVAFAEVQHEWATWADRDLPSYYRAFVTAQAQLARAGVHTCWMQTVAFLGARRGGPACWNLGDVAAEDFEFFLPYSVMGLSQGLV